jgi:hypothetical protein
MLATLLSVVSPSCQRVLPILNRSTRLASPQKKMCKIFFYFFLIPFCAVVSSGSPLDLSNTFLTPESDGLPEGTYIAMGLSGIAQLDEYLDRHPEAAVTRLFVSDSTVAEVGYITPTSKLEDDSQGFEKNGAVPDEPAERGESMQHRDAKVEPGSGAVQDIEAPLQRIFEKVAPSLEALSYLTHMPTHSYDQPDGYDLRADNDPRIRVLLARDYPSLARLTFRNRLIDGATPVYDHQYQFPSITHLHLDNRMYNSPTLRFLHRSFPRLTHLFLPDVTGEYELPSDMTPIHPPPTLWRSFKEYVLRIPRKPSPL